MRILEDRNINNIYISLNYFCNNKCIMCGVPFKKHNLYNEDIEFYKNQLQQIPFSISKNDIITISGGEPFNFNQIFKFIEYIRENYDCRITIFTNGRALKKREYVEQLKKYKIDKLIIPYFSSNENIYDLVSGVKGSYREWLLAIRNLEEYRIYYELKFLPMLQNYKDMLESYIFCKENFRNAVFTVCGVQYFGEAVNNIKEIGIPYFKLKDVIEETIEFAINEYNEYIPIYRFPMCVLDAKYNNNGVLTLFKEYIIAPDYSDINLREEEKIGFEIPKQCQECVNFCDWYSKKYGEIFGFSELRGLKSIKNKSRD